MKELNRNVHHLMGDLTSTYPIIAGLALVGIVLIVLIMVFLAVSFFHPANKCTCQQGLIDTPKKCRYCRLESIYDETRLRSTNNSNNL